MQMSGKNFSLVLLQQSRIVIKKDAAFFKYKHLSDAHDDFVAAQELAEEAGGEVERIHLEELARQWATYRQLRGHRRRRWERWSRRRRHPRSLGPSGGEVKGEAAATELLLLPGGGALEARGRGRAGGGHRRWPSGGRRRAVVWGFAFESVGLDGGDPL